MRAQLHNGTVIANTDTEHKTLSWSGMPTIYQHATPCLILSICRVHPSTIIHPFWGHYFFHCKHFGINTICHESTWYAHTRPWFWYMIISYIYIHNRLSSKWRLPMFEKFMISHFLIFWFMISWFPITWYAHTRPWFWYMIISYIYIYIHNRLSSKWRLPMFEKFMISHYNWCNNGTAVGLFDNSVAICNGVI